jgi:hypothetical protein
VSIHKVRVVFSVRLMSALPPKADIAERKWDVRFVPKAEIAETAVRSDVYAARTAGECAIWACRFRKRPIGEDRIKFCRRGRDAAGASSTVWMKRRAGVTKSIRPIYADYGTQWQEVAVPPQHGRIKAGRATAVQKQSVLASKLIPEKTRELAKRNF